MDSSEHTGQADGERQTLDAELMLWLGDGACERHRTYGRQQHRRTIAAPG